MNEDFRVDIINRSTPKSTQYTESFCETDNSGDEMIGGNSSYAPKMEPKLELMRVCSDDDYGNKTDNTSNKSQSFNYDEESCLNKSKSFNGSELDEDSENKMSERNSSTTPASSVNGSISEAESNVESSGSELDDGCENEMSEQNSFTTPASSVIGSISEAESNVESSGSESDDGCENEMSGQNSFTTIVSSVNGSISEAESIVEDKTSTDIECMSCYSSDTSGNDPNELCDILRFLLMSNSSKNFNWAPEIRIVISKLRQDGFIK